MPRVTINNFSCIKSADLDLAEINILIGPQGSGKSVTTKLTFFLADILTDFLRAAEEQASFDDYKKETAKRFSIWFPHAAWGAERFHISFASGEFGVRILRRVRSGVVADDVSVSFSKWFQNVYDYAVKAFKAARKTDVKENDYGDGLSTSVFEASWRVRNDLRLAVQRDLGGDFISAQTFIPAGRAFFTSIGRLVAGLEQGGLDPVTLRFARLFAGWRDQSASLIERLDSDAHLRRNTMMTGLFGGAVSARRESEYIQMEDGRKVPFGFLSSGQQELLPIWFYMENLIARDYLPQRRLRTARLPKQLVYIEEPEAHLFPTAQSRLMDYLISAVISERHSRSLVLTTHSPYIMTKINVYLKAGQIARRKKKNQELNDIVDRSCWIRSDQITAWSIESGNVSSIIDHEEGLIDGGYLDSVSDVMAEQFEKLLQLEASL